MRSTADPDEDSQQGPEHTDARPRADSSAMMQTSSRQQRSRQVQCCRSRAGELERESGKRARKLHRGKPADSEVQSQVNKEGRIQHEDCSQQQVKRKSHSADDTYRQGKRIQIRIQHKDEISHNSKAWGRSRVQCKREASGIRRAVAPDRSANDIANQVTMNRKKKKVITTRRKVACESDEEVRRQRETRIDDTPAVPNELTDHAVARGRDASLRSAGGHSPEKHTPQTPRKCSVHN